MKLLGYTLFEKNKKPNALAPVPARSSASVGEPIMTSTAAGYFGGTFMDLAPSFTTEKAKTIAYRVAHEHHEVNEAVTDIVNDAVVIDMDTSSDFRSVYLELSKVQIGDAQKKQILDAFDHVLEILDWNQEGQELFKRWYIDNKVVFYKVPNEDNTSIAELRTIDPWLVAPVCVLNVQHDDEWGQMVNQYALPDEFFIYMPELPEHDKPSWMSAQYIQKYNYLALSKESVCFVPSGQLDAQSGSIISYLHKALKPLNQLSAVEDAVVVYRWTRASERRVFYVDTGNLPPQKAEQFVHGLMDRYRNKDVYNNATGELGGERRVMALTEDFWIPRNGNKTTEVTTLPGAQNLGELGDLDYYLQKLRWSLHRPRSRYQSDNPFSMGSPGDISRDEVRHQKFVNTLRMRFSTLFHDLLRTELAFRRIASPEEYKKIIKPKMKIMYTSDTVFSEAKDAELMQMRINAASTAEPYQGRFYSERHIRKNILRQTDEQIAIMDVEIKAERLEKKMIEDAEGLPPGGLDFNGDNQGDVQVDEDGNPIDDMEQGQGKVSGKTIPPKNPVEKSNFASQSRKNGNLTNSGIRNKNS